MSVSRNAGSLLQQISVIFIGEKCFGLHPDWIWNREMLSTFCVWCSEMYYFSCFYSLDASCLKKYKWIDKLRHHGCSCANLTHAVMLYKCFSKVYSQIIKVVSPQMLKCLGKMSWNTTFLGHDCLSILHHHKWIIYFQEDWLQENEQQKNTQSNQCNIVYNYLLTSTFYFMQNLKVTASIRNTVTKVFKNIYIFLRQSLKFGSISS